MLTRQDEQRLKQESIASRNQNLSMKLFDEMFEFTGAGRSPINSFHRAASKGCSNSPQLSVSATHDPDN